MIERGKENNLVQPHFNPEWMHKSFSFIATIHDNSKLWNRLSLFIKNSDNP